MMITVDDDCVADVVLVVGKLLDEVAIAIVIAIAFAIVVDAICLNCLKLDTRTHSHQKQKVMVDMLLQAIKYC